MAAEHRPVFLRSVRQVLAERWDYVHIRLARQQFVEHFGEPAAPECIRVISGGSSNTRFGLAQIRRRASATVWSIKLLQARPGNLSGAFGNPRHNQVRFVYVRLFSLTFSIKNLYNGRRRLAFA